MEASREQAEVARQALVNVERPYIFVESIQIDFPETTVGSCESDIHHATKISYTIVNYGRVPAVVKTIWVRARRRDRRDHIPDQPDFVEGGNWLGQSPWLRRCGVP